MPARALPAICACALVLVSACEKAEAPPGPTYVPSAKVDKTLAKLGGVTVTAPDNLTLTESEGSATLTAPGFPTVEIRFSPSHDHASSVSGRSSSSGSTGPVEATYFVSTGEWVCTADKPGAFADLALEICDSLAAPVAPKVANMACETVEGFDAKAVSAAWSGAAAAFVACLRPNETQESANFGFNLSFETGSSNFARYGSPMNDVESPCVDAIYDGLRKDPALVTEGLEAGKIECKGDYSRY